VNECRQVSPGVWLGFAQCPGSGSNAASRRWPRDREAADRAVAEVLAASGFRLESCTVSRSHTRGVAGAMAAPPGFRVGVDLVSLDRVGRRHAAAILSRREWQCLAAWAPMRPALGWALKEAAAKATGNPLRSFPLGLEIEAGAAGLTVRHVVTGGLEFTAGWGLFQEFLFAWALSAGPLSSHHVARSR
jgi:hypothetical protein